MCWKTDIVIFIINESNFCFYPPYLSFYVISLHKYHTKNRMNVLLWVFLLFKDLMFLSRYSKVDITRTVFFYNYCLKFQKSWKLQFLSDRTKNILHNLILNIKISKLICKHWILLHISSTFRHKFFFFYKSKIFDSFYT